MTAAAVRAGCTIFVGQDKTSFSIFVCLSGETRRAKPGEGVGCELCRS
jgi:hypothetical protein